MGQGSQSNLYFEIDPTFDTSSKRFQYLSSTLKQTTAIVEDLGIRGSRSHHKDRVDQGTKKSAGVITMEPNKSELEFLINYILGGSTTDGVTTVAETLSSFSVLHDKADGKYQYDGCYVNKATFTAQSGQRLKLALDVIAKTCDASIASNPTCSVATDAAWIFHHGVLTIASTVYKMEQLTLTIDNKLGAYFDNSQTAHTIEPEDREVMLEVRLPASTTTNSLQDAHIASAASAAISLVFNNGVNTLTIDLPACCPNDSADPEMPGRGRTLQPLQYKCLANDSAKEVTFTIVANS